MDRCQHCRAATVLSEALADAACRPYSSNEESAARYLHVFGLDQLDLLGDRPCADRFWFQSPRYLRAMALLENTQKPRFGQMRVILGELRHVFSRLQRSFFLFPSVNGKLTADREQQSAASEGEITT